MLTRATGKHPYIKVESQIPLELDNAMLQATCHCVKMAIDLNSVYLLWLHLSDYSTMIYLNLASVAKIRSVFY